MKNFYSNNQNEFAVNNTVIEQSDLRIYPTQNSNKYVRRHKKIFIAIISLILVFAIIIAGIVINHNGYEHAEAQVCECRTIIRSLVYSGDDEEEISGNECALAERIKEAQKYSFFLPKDLKEQLKAFEQFQKNFP